MGEALWERQLHAGNFVSCSDELQSRHSEALQHESSSVRFELTPFEWSWCRKKKC